MSDRLKGLLEREDSSLVVGPQTAQDLRDWLAAFPEHPLPTAERVDAMVGRLAVATKERFLTVEEAKERLELYWRALREIPLVDLARGFDDLIKSKTFMPTPAEIYAAAGLYTRRREYLRSRARQFVTRHEREWRPPVEQLTGEELTALRAMLAQAQANTATKEI